MNEEDKAWFQKTINVVISDEISPEVAGMMVPVPHFVDFMRDPKEEVGEEEGGGAAGAEEEIVIPKIYEMASITFFFFP